MIAHAGEKLVRAVETILGGALLPRGELETALATYLVYYGNHVAREDEDVLGLAERHLTAEDWEAVRHAA